MIDRALIEPLRKAETARFRERNPIAASESEARLRHWHQGVPFHWMRDYPSPFPLVPAHAQGARLTTVDGQVLDDFCLGDTAAMFGHSPPALARAIAGQAAQGLSTMLPSPHTARVGELLAERFGLPLWQVTTTASEANRAIIRWCRAITGRDRVVIFNGCYHGAVDDIFLDLVDGEPETRRSLVGQVLDLRERAKVIEFNDIEALRAALAAGDVACILAEPVMTNVGMILPDAGFLETVRGLTTAAGTLLVWDETHTISSGPRGHSGIDGLRPDLFVIGKSIGGGVPCAAYGFTAEVGDRMIAARAKLPPGHSGIGTTLSANALAMAAMRAMLEEVMTDAAFAHMIALAAQMVAGIEGVIARHALPWHVANVGARVEIVMASQPPRNGSEARAAMNPALESLLHLFLLNRGTLLAPFHNMALASPVTAPDQVDRLIAHLDEAAAMLTGRFS